GSKGLPAEEREDLVRQLARLARSPAVQTLLAERLRDRDAPAPARRAVLRAMARSGLKEAPADWLAALAAVLGGDHPEVVGEAGTAAGSLRLPKQRPEGLAKALLGVGHNVKAPAPVRLGALSAVPGGLARVEPDLFAFLTEAVRPDRPVTDRALAADVLAHA